MIKKFATISKFLLAPLEVIPLSGMPLRYLRKGLLMGLIFILMMGFARLNFAKQNFWRVKIFSGWLRIWQNPAFPPEI